MSGIGIVLFVYSILEYRYLTTYRKSVSQCEKRLGEPYQIPEEVSIDILKQLDTMNHAKTFYRDLFECAEFDDIKYGNLVDLFSKTMGATQPVVDYMISNLEKRIGCRINEGYNESLHHAYSRNDKVIRAVYMPALFKFPISLAKYICDWIVEFEYTKIVTPHLIYWIRYRKTTSRKSCPDLSKRALNKIMLFICGIGVGPITYYQLLKHFYDTYDIIIMIEIKWISFHLDTEPVEDKILIQEISTWINNFIIKYPLDSMDFYGHSGGALHFKRLNEILTFNNKFLIEPACFLSGGSTATRQIYTYKTLNPLFHDPLIKNLPKLVDVVETVLLSDTVLTKCVLILSRNDTLFNPLRILSFIECYHPHVQVYMIDNSSHGDAVSKHYEQTAKIILNIINKCY